MSERPIRTLVVLASIREGRKGERVADWFMDHARKRPELDLELVDLREWLLPPFADARSPKAIGVAYDDAKTRAWAEKVGAADAYVFVTPEYNFGYPAQLKTVLDYVYAGWNGKPAGWVSYGGVAGGTRAVMQLRQVVIELQMVPLRAEVAIPWVGRAFDEHGAMVDEAPFAARTKDLLDALVWWGGALRDARERTPMPGHAPKT